MFVCKTDNYFRKDIFKPDNNGNLKLKIILNITGVDLCTWFVQKLEFRRYVTKLY